MAEERVKAVGVSMPPSMIRATTIAAALEGKSRSAYIRDVLSRSLGRRFDKGGDGRPEQLLEVVDGED